MLAAIGDALGWITEFEKSTDSLVKKYNSPFISSFHKWKRVAGGRFNGYFDDVSEGSYSDDTQLLLAVARSIKNDGTVDHEYFSKKSCQVGCCMRVERDELLKMLLKRLTENQQVGIIIFSHTKSERRSLIIEQVGRMVLQ